MPRALDELREHLADAQRLVDDVEPRGRRPRFQPRYLRAPSLQQAITTIGGHPGAVTLIAGAGASMEADLPSWSDLVTRILRASRPHVEADLRERWVRAVLSEGVVSAAAVAEALAPSREAFRDLVVRQLYREGASRDFAPGAIAQQVAWWKRRFGRDVHLATFNYDDMIERALEASGPVRSVADDRDEPAHTAVVRHLHGRLHDGAHDLDFVLSDDDYARFPLQERWQDRVMSRALDETMCVFVGLSFTDPNLTRWIHRSVAGRRRGGPPRIALFSRQSSPRLAPDVRAELEETTARRWEAAGVQVVFTDFFGELAQVLHEAALLRAGEHLPPFAERAVDRRRAAVGLLIPSGTARFPAAQRAASSWLGDIGAGVREVADASGTPFDGEQLALALWLVDHARGEVTLAAASDRAMTDRLSLQPVPMELLSPWASVETVTRGSAVDQHPDVYASRWRYVRALPLTSDADSAGRLVAGAVTLTSTQPYEQSAFSRMPREARREIDRRVVYEAEAIFA